MANEVKNISPMKLTLLVTIVPRDKEGFYIDYLQTLGFCGLSRGDYRPVKMLTALRCKDYSSFLQLRIDTFKYCSRYIHT